MSEDIQTFILDPDGRRWQISRRDAVILQEVQEVMRWWLPALTETNDLVTAVKAIEDLEAIIQSGRPPVSITEFTVSRVDQKAGGQSATLTVTPSYVSLSCSEWAPNLNGTLDCHTMTGFEGRLICLELDNEGSYDRDLFDSWYLHALETGPQEVRDQVVRGEISVQD